MKLSQILPEKCRDMTENVDEIHNNPISSTTQGHLLGNRVSASM